MGDVYVKLLKGFYFYGPAAKPKDKKYYQLLAAETKKKLPFECYQIALNILIRFDEGGLKLGGPEKEKCYTVKPGDMVAEMGAFRGYYSMYLSRQVGETGNVVAIEPVKDNLRYLEKNIKKNDLKNVIIVPKGVWSKKTTLTFSQRSEDFQSASIDMNYSDAKMLSIEVDTLDNILAKTNTDKINQMIIQLNGAEHEALKGLSEIKPYNFAIAARYNPGNQNVAEEIRKHLTDLGYKCTLVKGKYIFASRNPNSK